MLYHGHISLLIPCIKKRARPLLITGSERGTQRADHPRDQRPIEKKTKTIFHDDNDDDELTKAIRDSPEPRDGGEPRVSLDEPGPQARRIRPVRDLQRGLLLPHVDVVGQRGDRALDDGRGPQLGREEGHLHEHRRLAQRQHLGPRGPLLRRRLVRLLHRRRGCQSG